MTFRIEYKDQPMNPEDQRLVEASPVALEKPISSPENLASPVSEIASNTISTPTTPSTPLPTQAESKQNNLIQNDDMPAIMALANQPRPKGPVDQSNTWNKVHLHKQALIQSLKPNDSQEKANPTLAPFGAKPQTSQASLHPLKKTA